MNLQDYIKLNKLDETKELSNQELRLHILYSNQPDEVKRDLLNELESDEPLTVSSGLQRWFWILSIILIIIALWFIFG